MNNYDEGIGKDKQFFFAHSYGLPYLSGIGVYYFNKKSLYVTEANTSFAFSDASVGYNYELINNFYTGVNAGIVYLPSEETAIIPHFSSELIYKVKRQNTVLIRGGVQIPLLEMRLFYGSFHFSPYVRLTCLLP